MTTKLESPCLSQLALGRLASGQCGPNAAQTAHLADCGFCRAQLEAEAALVQIAAQEPLPAALAALIESESRRTTNKRPVRHVSSHITHAVMAVLAIVTVAGVARSLVGGADAPATMALTQVGTPPIALEHPKGGVQMFGAVKDAQNHVRALDDVQHLHDLKPGDTLQLQVQSFEAAVVTVVDADDHTVYYTGDVPVGGWLPMGIEVTAGAPLHIAVQVCSKDGATCTTQEMR